MRQEFKNYIEAYINLFPDLNSVITLTKIYSTLYKTHTNK